MLGFNKSKTKLSARQQIAIEGVQDGVLILPANRYRAILSASSINFELKSDQEQDALIDTYQAVLNSLGWPIQILIRTREINIDKYLVNLELQIDSDPKITNHQQLDQYQEFIRSLIKTNKILTRQFYVVIPYQLSETADFDLVKEQLDLRTDILTKGLGRLGIQARPLSSLEILDLFYSFYSPDQAKVQPLTDQALELINQTVITTEVLNV